MLSQLLENNKPILIGSNSFLKPRLNQIIGLLCQLEVEANEKFTQIITKAELQKDAHLVSEGAISRNIYILESGIARMFIRKHNVEATRYFFVPGEFAEVFQSSALQIPSRVNIQLISNATVNIINRQALFDLSLEFPLIGEIERHIVNCHAAWLEEQMDRMKFSTAEENYRFLLNNQPYLLKHIPLTYIASYMGITLETLSRIRAKQILQG